MRKNNQKYHKSARVSSLLVALAGLLGRNLACGVADNPLEELAEGDQASLGVIHAGEDGLALLCGAIRRSQTESARHQGSTLNEAIELVERDLALAALIDLDEEGQEELVEASVLTGVLVAASNLKSLQQVTLAEVLHVVQVNLSCTNGTCLACDVGEGPVDELSAADPATSRASLAVDGVEHGLARCRALVHGATVLCLPAWCKAETAGHGCNLLAKEIELLSVDLAVLVHVNIAESHSQEAIELALGLAVWVLGSITAPLCEGALVVPPSLSAPRAGCSAGAAHRRAGGEHVVWKGKLGQKML